MRAAWSVGCSAARRPSTVAGTRARSSTGAAGGHRLLVGLQWGLGSEMLGIPKESKIRGTSGEVEKMIF